MRAGWPLLFLMLIAYSLMPPLAYAQVPDDSPGVLAYAATETGGAASKPTLLACVDREIGSPSMRAEHFVLWTEDARERWHLMHGEVQSYARDGFTGRSGTSPVDVAYTGPPNLRRFWSYVHSDLAGNTILFDSRGLGAPTPTLRC